MSRYCAKPTCSELVASCFEMSREEQRVTRTNTPTPHGILLCESHADRFRVPAGWSLITSDELAEEPVEKSSGEGGSAWFVPAASFADASGEVLTKPEVLAESDTAPSKLANAPEGSMLDRAFNGPKERHGNTDDSEVAEIPFPPHVESAAAI